VVDRRKGYSGLANGGGVKISLGVYDQWKRWCVTAFLWSRMWVGAVARSAVFALKEVILGSPGHRDVMSDYFRRYGLDPDTPPGDFASPAMVLCRCQPLARALKWFGPVPRGSRPVITSFTQEQMNPERNACCNYCRPAAAA